MKLFQKTQNWLNSEIFKRICLNYKEGLSDFALFTAIQSGKLSNFNNLFCLDINRDSSNKLFQNLVSDKQIESYIFQPSSWNELIEAFLEMQEFLDLRGQENTFASKTTLVINDWQALLYLFANSQKLNSPTPSEFLLQLKFLNDKSNIILLNNCHSNHSFNKTDKLKDINLFGWSHEVFQLVDKYKLEVQKTFQFNQNSSAEIINNINTVPEPSFINTKPESNITESQKNINYSINSINSLAPKSAYEEAQALFETNNNSKEEEIFEEIKEKSIIISSASEGLSQQERSVTYEKLMQNLASAQSRQDLLIVRKEIQSYGEALSAREKITLSDIYKIHLQRIKLLEDSFLSS